jgi:hypothetical protein
MPDAGRTHGPPATKNAGGSHHRYAEHSGIPCAMVYGLWRTLPGVPGFIAPVASRGVSAVRTDIANSQSLTSASGGQDHTLLPSAGDERPSSAAPASIATRLPTFVTIAKRPSFGAGCAQTTTYFC